MREASCIFTGMKLHRHIALLQNGKNSIKVFRTLLNPWGFKFVNFHPLKKPIVKNLEIRIVIIKWSRHPIKRMRTGTERRLRFTGFALYIGNRNMPLTGDGREYELIHSAALQGFSNDSRFVVEITTIECLRICQAIISPDMNMSITNHLYQTPYKKFCYNPL